MLAALLMLLMFGSAAAAETNEAPERVLSTENKNSAQEISLDSAYTDTLSSSNTSYYYKFTIDSSGDVMVYTYFYMDYVYIYVYDEDGNIMWSTLASDGSQEELMLNAGTYYVAFVRCGSSNSGKYVFAVLFSSAQESFAETAGGSNETIAQASVLSSLDDQYKGLIALNETQDCYKFVMNQSGNMTFTVSANIQYLCFELLDENEETLFSCEEIWDSSEMVEIEESIDLEEGTYYLILYSYCDYDLYSAGEYELTLKYREYLSDVTLSYTSTTYTGLAKIPDVTVKNSAGETLKQNTDYTVAYSGTLSSGTATVTVTGTGDYIGTVTKTYVIEPQTLLSSNISVSYTSAVYTGSAFEPDVQVENSSGTTLKEGTDYTVSYSDNTDAGTAAVTVTGMGNYTGTVTKTFTISPQSLASSRVTVEYISIEYTGSALTPEITVTNSAGDTITEGTDYTLSYSDNTDAGIASVTVTGNGNYTGSVTKYFEITTQVLSSSNVTLSYTSTEYTGSALTPSVTVRNSAGSTLNAGTDYTVSYSDNTDIGTAVVRVVGTGNYSGTVTVTFEIETASRDDVSGTCGYRLTWLLTTDGVLTISGSGTMYSYDSSESLPWTEYRDEITEVIIEDGVTSITDYAFHQCVNLVSITIPDSVTSIGEMAFNSCNSLEAVTIPDGVSEIEKFTFMNCWALTEITIPDNVTSIDSMAFYNCQSLQTIYFKCSAPSFGSYVFYYVGYYVDTYAYYPSNDSSWTDDVLTGYSGIINWIGYKYFKDGINYDSETGLWGYYTDGEIDTSYTGLVKYSSQWWYVENGIIDFEYSGIVEYNGSYWYVSDSVVQIVTGFYKAGDTWYYIDNGAVDFDYTGLAKNDYGWWYVTNGQLDTSYTGLAKNDYGWWYVSNGKLDTSYTGLAKNAYGWWYVTNGQLDTSYTGLAKNAYGWWYVSNGKLDTSYTGLAKNDYGWWYVTEGKLDTSYTGLAKNDYGWWYVTNGKLDTSYTGLAKNDYGWWYVTNGQLDTSYTGMAKNAYGWWYVTNGKLDTSYTGLAKNAYGTWYMVNGQLSTYTGTVTINGVTYTVKNGLVVS